MNSRRGFLGGLAALIAGSAIDPERLLWVPGKKTIFVPNIIRGNEYLTIEKISMEMLRVLNNKIDAAMRINAQYDMKFLMGDKWETRKPHHVTSRFA